MPKKKKSHFRIKARHVSVGGVDVRRHHPKCYVRTPVPTTGLLRSGVFHHQSVLTFEEEECLLVSPSCLFGCSSCQQPQNLHKARFSSSNLAITVAEVGQNVLQPQRPVRATNTKLFSAARSAPSCCSGLQLLVYVPHSIAGGGDKLLWPRPRSHGNHLQPLIAVTER